MAWLYVKRKDKPQVHCITEEAYKQTFKEQGFEIVSNAKNDGSTAQSKADSADSENVQPVVEKPVKRQYNKRSGV